MRRNEPPGVHRLGAFTMVEVVAALAIASGVIVGLLIARERAVATCIAARTTMASARMCATLAARVRAGEIGEGSGVIEEQGEFRWRIVREVPPSEGPRTVRAYMIEVLPPDGDALNGCIARVWRHERSEMKGTAP